MVRQQAVRIKECSAVDNTTATFRLETEMEKKIVEVGRVSPLFVMCHKPRCLKVTDASKHVL